MKQRIKLPYSLGLSVIGSMTAVGGAYLLLRGLGVILYACGGVLGEDTAEMLGSIFSQLKQARIAPGWLPPALLFTALGVLSNLKSRRFLWGFPLVWLCACAASLLTANVNGVCFGDIVSSLAQMAQNGLFSVL